MIRAFLAHCENLPPPPKFLRALRSDKEKTQIVVSTVLTIVILRLQKPADSLHRLIHRPIKFSQGRTSIRF